MDTNGRDRSLGALSSPQRNNYFYGKLMDVPHFDMEQSYLNRKRWLLNRLGLGSGVLCGLNVTIKDKKVCVSPGVAVDAYGREIVVPHEVCLDPWTLTDECGCLKTPALSKTEAHDVYLCLAYKECQTDFMPVLVTDCNTKQECVPGTTVENYCVLVKEAKQASSSREESLELARPERPESPLLPQPFVARSGPVGLDPALCKVLRSDASEAEKRKKLCELNPGASCTVAKGETCVALGTVPLKADGTIDTDKFKRDQCSARHILVSNEHLLDMLLCLSGPRGDAIPTESNLTKVEKLNEWTHDGSLSVDVFMQGLSVSFTDNVTVTAKNGQGWFLVTVEYQGGKSPEPGLQQAVIPIPHQIIGMLKPPGTILVQRVLEEEIKVNGNTIFFKPHPEFKATFEQFSSLLIGTKPLVRVVIKCDFILDSRGRPVDGDHLKGTLPSGDTVPGGDFESWFVLTLAAEPSPEPPPRPPIINRERGGVIK